MTTAEPTTDTAPDAATTPAGDGSDSSAPSPAGPTDEQQTFAREYVEQLRRENAAARVKAKRADALGARLVGAYAAATGRLADPSDLPYSDELLDEDGVVDPDKVAAAVDELLARKPHLATRRPTGDVGQGARSAAPEQVSLAGLLRAGAG